MLLSAVIGILAQVPGTSQDFATSSLDELIARLPVVGFESRFDRDAGSPILDPACEELTRRLAAGVRLSNDQWRTALLGTKAIRSRELWPEETPLAVSIRVPAWLPLSLITATPREAGWPAARAGKFVRDTCANCRRNRQYREAYQELGRLDPGRHTVVFDVTVEQVQGERPRYEVPPPPVSLWNGTLSLAVELVTDRNRAFVPVSDNDLDDTIRRSLRLTYTTRKEGEESVVTPVLGLAFSDEDAERFEGIAVALRIEVWRGDSLEETLTPRLSGPDDRRSPVWGALLKKVPGDALLEPSLLAEFRVEVRGIYLDNERNWNASRWWNGSVRESLSAIQKQTEARGR